MRVRGDEISFTVLNEIKGSTVRQQFSGRASGDSIQGTVLSSGPRLQGVADWAAERVERASPAGGAKRDRWPNVSAQAPGRALAAASPAR
jgi:hypothetical protein